IAHEAKVPPIALDCLVWDGPKGRKMNARQLNSDTETFQEEDFKEQSRTMNITVLQLRMQLETHLRCARREGRKIKTASLKSHLESLQGILERYQAEGHAKPRLLNPR